MCQRFRLEKITYPVAAPGWVDGVYYPREPQIAGAGSCAEPGSHAEAGNCAEPGSHAETGSCAEPDSLCVRNIGRIHSRVWQEVEETGFGIYYYEETTQIVTQLSGSNYQVKLCLENPTEKPYSCHVRANGIVKVSGVQILPGERKELPFLVCMTDGQLVLTLAVGAMEEIHGEPLEGDVYLGSIWLLEEKVRERREKPHLFLVSDSTVQSYERHFYPQTGWGQVFWQFFRGARQCREYPAEHCDYPQGRAYELPRLVIENRSIGGRSAKSFYEEGKLDQILEVICPGDYMFVQFAHNDSTAIRPNRYIAPENFPFYLQRYVDACRRRGVCLVFVTPVTMRVLEEDGRNQLCFAAYREQMLQLAKKEGLPLLDLSARSTEYLNKIGYEASRQLYLWFEEGRYPDGAYAGGVSDKCHLQEYGAKIYADMVSQLLSECAEGIGVDELKTLVAPVPLESIPEPDAEGKATKPDGEAEASGGKQKPVVTGFVVQEVSVENGVGSFLLNWNPLEEAEKYRVYGRREEETDFRLLREITKAEKEAFAVLPFTAEAGARWQYCVAAVSADGREGEKSRIQEADLRV